jgi:hypothetical protein
LHQKIVVVGNQVQGDRLRQMLDEIPAELRRIERAEDVSADTLAPIRTAAEIIVGIGADESERMKLKPMKQRRVDGT